MKEQPSQLCEAKEKLLQEYTDSTRVFSDGLNALNARRGVTERQDYEVLERAVFDARSQSEQARLVYEQHVAEHKC